MTLIASDGLEYEDLKARLLGNPAKSWHNTQVQAFRDAKDLFHEYEVEAYVQGVIASRKIPGVSHPTWESHHSLGLTAMRDARHAREYAHLNRTRRTSRTRLPNPLPAPAPALHPAD